MTRKRQQYDGPGSFARILEAGHACADADSDDDVAYHAAEMRMRSAVAAHAPRILGAKGGRAWAAKLSPDERSQVARRLAKARWDKRKRAAPHTSET